MTTYCIGISRCDITPPVGTRLCGFAARTEPSTGVYDSLQAVAMVVEDGATAVLFVAADLLGFYDRCESVREALCRALPIPETHIVLAGSHTHCGPHIREFDRPRLGPPDPAYLQLLTERIVGAACAAWQGRREAGLSFGVGTCPFAVSRRRLRADGKVEWGPYPEGPRDHQVPVLAAGRPDGTLFALLYSYACHPTSRAGTLIGGDYVGLAHDRIHERLPGVTAGFLQGCGADQKPLPVDPEAATFVPREVAEVKRLGDELGDAVVSVVRGGDMQTLDGAISVCRRFVELRCTPPDLDYAGRVLADGDKRLRTWAERMLTAAEQGVELNRAAQLEIQTLTFGRALVVITLAGEITVEHGLRLKRDLAGTFDNVLVVGYANHILGYIPVARQIPEGGYCVEWANRFHGRTGPWTAETEETIHNAIHDMVR